MTTHSPHITIHDIDLDWMKLDLGQARGNYHGIVQGSAGEIYVQNACESITDSCIYIADSTGNIIDRLQHTTIQKPHGLESFEHPDHGECLLVTDLEAGLYLMSKAGQLYWHVPKPMFYQFRWQLHYEPSNCGVDAERNIYLMDGYGSYTITKLNADGKELKTFGGPHDSDAGLIHPHGGSVVDYAGESYLAIGQCLLSSTPKPLMQEYGLSSCIKLFKLNGNFSKTIELDTISPRHIRAFDQGYVIPDFQNRILITNKEFEIIYSVGQQDERFERPCDVELNLSRPHDACIVGDTLFITSFEGSVAKLEFEMG